MQPADRMGAARAISPSGLQQRDRCEHMACGLPRAAAIRWALDTLKAVHVSGRIERAISDTDLGGVKDNGHFSTPQRAQGVSRQALFRCTDRKRHR